MAAPMEQIPKHHIREELCSTRPTYREGRKQKAVRVYTVNLESRYLLIQGVPAVGATHELIKLFALHGPIDEYRILDEYPTADQFTDVFLIKFKRIQSARYAKHKLDDWSFFGGVLHICYAPEYESVDDTREKLQERRKTIAAKIRQSNGNNQSQEKRQLNEREDINFTSRSESAVFPSKFDGHKSFSSTSDINPNKNFQIIETNVIRGSSDNIQRLSSNCMENNVPFERGISYLSSKLDFHGNNSTDDHHQQELNIHLPPPPRKGEFINLPHFNPRGTYEFARVPTAHASLPLNYDGRITTEKCDIPTTVSTESQSESSQFYQNENYREKNKFTDKGDNSLRNASEEHQHSASSIHDSSIKDSSDKKIVIRDYKKPGVVPKFIPRQTLNLSKKKKGESFENKDGKMITDNVDDKLNKELRKNALTLLSKPQGPVSLSGDEPQVPTKGENSVQETVTQIRKRLNQFSSTLQPPLQKKKKPS